MALSQIGKSGKDREMKVAEYQLYELYDDLLNQVYPMVKFGDMEYEPARVLKEVDPIAYSVGFSDWVSSEECEDCGECVIDCKCEEAI